MGILHLKASKGSLRRINYRNIQCMSAKPMSYWCKLLMQINTWRVHWVFQNESIFEMIQQIYNIILESTSKWIASHTLWIACFKWLGIKCRNTTPTQKRTQQKRFSFWKKRSQYYPTIGVFTYFTHYHIIPILPGTYQYLSGFSDIQSISM